MAQISAFVFPGTMTMTDTSMVSMASITDTSFVIQEQFNFYNDEFDRAGSVTTANITHYIQVTTNINSLIHYHANANITDASGNTTVDDVWSFDGAYFSDLSGGLDVSYNLPTISSTRVELKDYYAHFMNLDSANVDIKWRYTGLGHDWTTYTGDVSGAQIAQIFDLDVALSSNTDGVVTGVTSFYDFSGTGFEIEVPENIAFAQVLSLEYSNYASKASASTTDTTDTLTYSIAASNLNNLASGEIKDKRNAVDALYTGQNIFSAWSITFDAQDASGLNQNTYNTITNYARHATNNWTQSSYGFSAGQRIVTTNSQSFTMSILDKDGDSITLIPQGADPTPTIYGVLRQSA